jgi:hypothetical protein
MRQAIFASLDFMSVSERKDGEACGNSRDAQDSTAAAARKESARRNAEALEMQYVNVNGRLYFLRIETKFCADRIRMEWR